MNLSKLCFRILFLFALSFAFPGCSSFRPATKEVPAIHYHGMVELNGMKQAVVVKGTSVDNPILIYLHGGPGFPLFPYLKDFAELEKQFTVVFWEQRGTGKSFNRKIKDSSMATDTLISDLNQLVDWTFQRYQCKKVFLLGHSWGTNLGMLYASKYPDRLYAYIGTGQSVNLQENEILCLKYANQEALLHHNKKALRQLNNIDTLDYTLDDALKVRRWIFTYGGIVHRNNEEKGYINHSVLKDILNTPEYSFKDKMGILFHSTYSGKELWDDMLKINLFQQVPKVLVPVYFFEGRYDHLVSSQLAENYFYQLDDPSGKHLIWFEQSAHRPGTEEPEKFIDEMNLVKEECYKP